MTNFLYSIVSAAAFLAFSSAGNDQLLPGVEQAQGALALDRRTAGPGSSPDLTFNFDGQYPTRADGSSRHKFGLTRSRRGLPREVRGFPLPGGDQRCDSALHVVEKPIRESSEMGVKNTSYANSKNDQA